MEIRPSKDQMINAISMSASSGNFEARHGVDPSKICSYCWLCDRTFRNRGSTLFHMRKRHKEEVAGFDSTINGILGVEKNCAPGVCSKLTFHCPMDECVVHGSHFSSSKLLVQHFQKKHMEKKHKCCDCPARFALERDLRYHRKKICPGRKCSNNANTHREHSCQVESTQNSQSDYHLQSARTLSAQGSYHCRAGSRILLIPVRASRKIVYRKILPKSCERRTVSTQTDERQQEQIASNCCCNSGHHFPVENANFCVEQHCVDSNYFVHPSKVTEQINQQSIASNPPHQFQEVHNAYAQTTYPQTLDFGAQHPSSSSIYLPPLVASSTQTLHPFSFSSLDAKIFEGCPNCSALHAPQNSMEAWNSDCQASHG